MRRLLPSVLLPLLTSAACVSAQVPPPAAEQVFYEMVVTAPGSRSQGVRGQLFDAKGQPQSDVPTLEPVRTPIGAFDRIGCTHLWSVCGHLRRVEGFSPGGPTNDPTVDGPTLFRVSRVETTAGPRFRGELLDDGRAVPLVDRIETPMGPFVTFEGKFMGQDWGGWIPADWLPEKPR